MHFLSSNKLKIGLLTFFIPLVISIVFGAEFGTATVANIEAPLGCGDMSFGVEGNMYIKPDQKGVYTVKTNSILDQQANVEYELRQGDKLIEVGSEHQFTYLFTDPGTYLLKTILRRSETCIQASEQHITVAKQIRLGIGLNEEDNSFLIQSIKNQGIGFVFISAANNTQTEDGTIKRIQEIAQVLPSSDVLFVGESQARLLFDHLDDMRTYGIGFPERIILIGNIGTSALRRLLHQSPTITNFSEIAITPKPYISSVIQQLLNNGSLQQLNVVRLVHPQNTPTNRRLPISRGVDYLLTHGMSINFILFLLCIPVIALCLVLLKQVVGFNIGGIYYILLASAASIFVGWEISLLMFFSALLGQILALLITKKIYLLYAPKVGLTITLTCITFIGVNILLIFWGYTFRMPTDPVYAFFPLLVFSLMMQYIYPQHNSLIKKDWWVGFLQFVGGVRSMTFLIQWTQLQQFVLGYPDSVIIVLLAIIYIGRYAGLQIGEYVRFWPLISKHLIEEE